MSSHASSRRDTLSSADEWSLTTRPIGRVERIASVAIGLLALDLSLRASPGWKAIGCVGGLGLVARGLSGRCLSLQGGCEESEGRACGTIGNKRGVHVIESMTISRPIDEVYARWRAFEELPKTLSHLDQVEVISPTRSRWSVHTSLAAVSWEAEIIEDQPNALISWRSTEDSIVQCAGSVRMKPMDERKATELLVNLRYDVIGARWVAWLESWWGSSPDEVIREDLRRFKQQMETGELATVEGQPRGS